MTNSNHLHPISRCIVRIFKKSVEGGRYVEGAGFLINKDGENSIVCTCAHVVANAISGCKETDREPPPNATVYLDFPFLRSCQKESCHAPEEVMLEATIKDWLPKNSEDESGDIAILSLTGNLPSAACPAKLLLPTKGNLVDVYGFPKDYDTGVWTTSYCLGLRTANGWHQMDAQSELGIDVRPGVSGAPVWDQQNEGVVGMVTTRAKGRDADKRVAFFIPNSSLAGLCGLKLPETEPAQNRRMHPNKDFLPYLVDRHTQEKELCDALLNYQGSKPFVFVVHGTPDQGHDTFLTRIHRIILPDCLKLEEDIISDYELTYPRNIKDWTQLSAELLDDLYQKIMLDDPINGKESKKDIINDKLAKHRVPVLIYTRLGTDDFDHCVARKIKHYLSFWNESWLSLKSGQKLLVFLFIKYEVPQKRSLLQRFLRRSVREKHYHSFMQFVGQASWEELKLERLFCQEISELDNIRQKDVSSWLDDMEKKHQLPLTKVRNEISDWKETYPMDKLYPLLFDLLEKCRV